MKNKTDANGKQSTVDTKPYAMLGAGQLAASIWKTSDTRDQFAYRFNVFRMSARRGQVTQRFTPSDLPDLARLTQLLSFEISEDGCLDGELRDDLSCLAACLDDVLPGGSPMPGRARLPRHVARALEKTLEYLLEEEGPHFAANPSNEHIYRSVLFVACWLDDSLSVVHGIRELEDLESLDYFGSCPICARTDGYVNLHRAHWFVCHKHQVRWCVGENLFSSWRRETPSDWKTAWEEINAYRVIKPLSPTVSEDEKPTS